MLTPEGNIHLKAAPMNSYFQTTSHGILLSHAVKNNIDGALQRNSAEKLQCWKTCWPDLLRDYSLSGFSTCSRDWRNVPRHWSTSLEGSLTTSGVPAYFARNEPLRRVAWTSLPVQRFRVATGQCLHKMQFSMDFKIFTHSTCIHLHFAKELQSETFRFKK